MAERNPIFTRTELMLGSATVEALRRTRVAIFGLGGVGSWCAESLVRTGVGELMLVDTSNAATRRLFAEKAEAENAALRRFFGKTGVDTLELSTAKPYIDEVRALFKRRSARRGGRRGMA